MKHFSRALVWLTASEIIFNLAGYVIHASLGRILGPEDYGRFGVIITLTTMIIVLLGNGVPTAMSKFIAENFDTHPGRVKNIKATAILLQALIMIPATIFFYLLAPWIATTVLRDPSLTELFQISALIIPGFALASFYFYYYTGLHYFRLQAVLKTIRAVARIIFIVGFAYYWGVTGAVSGYIVAPLAVFVIAFLYDLFKVSPNLPEKDSDYHLAKSSLFQYAWPFTLFLIFYELVITADLYFVKALLQDDYLTGLYNAAITVGRIPYYLFYALTIILLPAIAKAKTVTSSQEAAQLVQKTLILIYALLLPMVTFLFAYSHQVLTFFYGKKYLGALPAFEIFVFGAGFLTVFYVLAFALHGAGRVKVPMWLSFAGIILLSALNLSLIPLYQLSGASLAVTLTSVFLAGAALAYTKMEFQISLMPKTFFMTLLSTAIFTALALIIPANQYLFIPIGGCLFLFHLGFLYYTNTIQLEDFLKPRKTV
jgi:stage V sporulation protein B